MQLQPCRCPSQPCWPRTSTLRSSGPRSSCRRSRSTSTGTTGFTANPATNGFVRYSPACSVCRERTPVIDATRVVRSMSDSEFNAIPVAIIGGGPVGLMLALFLDWHGVRSVLFNREATTRWHPKGSTEGSRTMEHFRRLGIAGEIRKLGLPEDHPTDVAYFTRFGAHELARLRMPSADEARQQVAASAKTDQIPEPIHRANQMHVERFLFEHARTRPNITMRFGWNVEQFAQDEEQVRLAAVNSEGTKETWHARY